MASPRLKSRPLVKIRARRSGPDGGAPFPGTCAPFVLRRPFLFFVLLISWCSLPYAFIPRNGFDGSTPRSRDRHAARGNRARRRRRPRRRFEAVEGNDHPARPCSPSASTASTALKDEPPVVATSSTITTVSRAWPRAAPRRAGGRCHVPLGLLADQEPAQPGLRTRARPPRGVAPDDRVGPHRSSRQSGHDLGTQVRKSAANTPAPDHRGPLGQERVTLPPVPRNSVEVRPLASVNVPVFNASRCKRAISRPVSSPVPVLIPPVLSRPRLAHGVSSVLRRFSPLSLREGQMRVVSPPEPNPSLAALPALRGRGDRTPPAEHQVRLMSRPDFPSKSFDTPRQAFPPRRHPSKLRPRTPILSFSRTFRSFRSY